VIIKKRKPARERIWFIQAKDEETECRLIQLGYRTEKRKFRASGRVVTVYSCTEQEKKFLSRSSVLRGSVRFVTCLVGDPFISYAKVRPNGLGVRGLKSDVRFVRVETASV